MPARPETVTSSTCAQATMTASVPSIQMRREGAQEVGERRVGGSHGEGCPHQEEFVDIVPQTRDAVRGRRALRRIMTCPRCQLQAARSDGGASQRGDAQASRLPCRTRRWWAVAWRVKRVDAPIARLLVGRTCCVVQCGWPRDRRRTQWLRAPSLAALALALARALRSQWR